MSLLRRDLNVFAAMIRIAACPLVLLLVIAAPAAAQHEVVLSREGDSLTITLPDGATETIALDADQVLRLEVRDGEVVIVQRPARARALAFAAPDSIRGQDVYDLEIDSVLERVPEIVRERLERVALPRIRLEVDVPTELRRDIAASEAASRRLAGELRRAVREGDAREAERLRAALRQTLEEAFELHQQARQARIEALQQRRAEIAAQERELAEEVARREQRRAEIIERRIDELTRERDELDWD